MSTDSDTDLLSASLVLSPYREQIDQLNHILVDLLAKRMEICRGSRGSSVLIISP